MVLVYKGDDRVRRPGQGGWRHQHRPRFRPDVCANRRCSRRGAYRALLRLYRPPHDPAAATAGSRFAVAADRTHPPPPPRPKPPQAGAVLACECLPLRISFPSHLVRTEVPSSPISIPSLGARSSTRCEPSPLPGHPRGHACGREGAQAPRVEGFMEPDRGSHTFACAAHSASATSPLPRPSHQRRWAARRPPSVRRTHPSTDVYTRPTTAYVRQ